MADNPPPSSADVMECGSLYLPELSGSHRPVMGLLYLYLYLKIWNNESIAFVMERANTST
jgi:hypothetical protein